MSFLVYELRLIRATETIKQLNRYIISAQIVSSAVLVILHNLLLLLLTLLHLIAGYVYIVLQWIFFYAPIAVQVSPNDRLASNNDECKYVAVVLFVLTSVLLTAQTESMCISNSFI